MRYSVVAAALLAAHLAAGCAQAQPAAGPVENFDATWQEGRWAFSNGPEFPGAKGAFARSEDAAGEGQYGGRLDFDFTDGGNYVAAVLRLDDAPQVAAVRVRVRKPRNHRLTFRYTDPTGQTLQRGFRAPDDRWADVFIPMDGWTGHWGGKNDGVPHGPPKLIAFLIENTGRVRGRLLIDDVRLVPGKPGEGAGMTTSEIATATFAAGEGWSAWTSGNGGTTKLQGRSLVYDFTKGATAINLGQRDYSILGLPKAFRIRLRGKAPEHPVSVHLATHFMTFEKTVGRFKDAGDGTSELVFEAPPGEGWRWFGGENDGKIHGPLRLHRVILHAGDKPDSGEVELLDIRATVRCDPDRACVLLAEHRGAADGGGEFVATVRSVAPTPMNATVAWTLRDWAGKTVGQGQSKVTVPPGGEPVDVAARVPDEPHGFLEAEFELQAPGQVTPPALAYWMAPIEPHGAADLDPASPFGMGLYLYRYPGHPAGLAEMDRAAQMAQDAGVKWSREEFGWARVEPERGRFDWTFYDQVVATAKRHGISIYGLLSYWSSWTKPYTPEGIEDYCRFAAAAAERYKADIRHWEVWNEPNIFFWQGPPDLYADLLTKAYAAIKKANPDAIVLGISTAGIDYKFIERTMELGAPFDILTIHPYRESLNDRTFIADLRKAADLARRPDGTRREVWITEMGWATYVPHNGMSQGFRVTTQRDQACLLARAYIDSVASGVAPNISWYDFRNDGTDPFNFEHNMGILARDFRPKPAYRALATVTRMLGKATFKQTVDLGPDMVAYRFDQAGAGAGGVLVVWPIGDDRTATLKVPADRPVTVVDLMGGREVRTPRGEDLALPLRTETPVFLLLEK